jgi:hypothetical protein
MIRASQRHGSRATTVATVFLAGFLALAGAGPALAQGPQDGGSSEAEITVAWHKDNMGFDVNSSKAISNVIVETCPVEDQRQAHKHEDEFQTEDIEDWTHRENETITDIWVKSGNNHDPNDPQPPAPYDNPGAGEHFENQNAVCQPQPCDGPENIDAVTEGSSILVNWTAVTGADNYTLYRSENGSAFEEIATTNDTDYRDDNVTVDETYTYRATATIEGTETDYCDQATVTAIPDLGTVFAGSMAALTGIAAYATYRRRN